MTSLSHSHSFFHEPITILYHPTKFSLFRILNSHLLSISLLFPSSLSIRNLVCMRPISIFSLLAIFVCICCLALEFEGFSGIRLSISTFGFFILSMSKNIFFATILSPLCILETVKHKIPPKRLSWTFWDNNLVVFWAISSKQLF